MSEDTGYLAIRPCSENYKATVVPLAANKVQAPVDTKTAFEQAMKKVRFVSLCLRPAKRQDE